MAQDVPPQGLVAGKYRITELIGRGGMGAVWEGTHTTLGTHVAVKFIESEYAESPEARNRFENEARAAAKLRSKHVVEVYDHGFTEDGRPYIVMEYLRGEPLDKRLDRVGRLAPKDAARMLLLCTAPLPIPSQAASDVPPGFDAWFAKALSREPEGRFASAGELAESLAAVCGLSVRGSYGTADIPIPSYAGGPRATSSPAITPSGPLGFTPPPGMSPQGVMPVTPYPSANRTGPNAALGSSASTMQMATGAPTTQTPAPTTRISTGAIIAAAAAAVIVLGIGVGVVLKMAGESGAAAAPPPEVVAPAPAPPAPAPSPVVEPPAKVAVDPTPPRPSAAPLAAPPRPVRPPPVRPKKPVKDKPVTSTAPGTDVGF